MKYFGIDPGQTGAAVAVAGDGLTVVAVRAWRRHPIPPGLADLVEPGDVVAVEAQYVGPGAHASLALAEWTGRLLEQLPAGCAILRPLATTWRARVLRRGRVSRSEAKGLAIAACRAHAIGLAPELASKPDVAEAWCMARYAWGAALAGVYS